MLKNLLLLTVCSACYMHGIAQSCTPQGDQITYGTNDTWAGYIYDNADFTGYLGYVNEGTPGNPNFSQNFGGSFSNYPTNGCTLYTETFTARYKLTKTFNPGSYTFTVSGDDKIRLSIDGGTSWLINQWGYNTYLPVSATVTLNGTYNMIIEYQEGTHQNKVYFNVSQTCVAGPITETYGTGSSWHGYYYSDVNFGNYKGSADMSAAATLGFSQNFGGSATYFTTSDCPVFTDFFSVRYRLRYNFPPNSYTFGVSGDDKYRLSLDGGSTWIIDRWNYDDGNSSRYYTSNLSGWYDLVLEYYEKDGSNFIEFSSNRAVILSMGLEAFTARRLTDGVLLNWRKKDVQSLRYFEIESSRDGQIFQSIGQVFVTQNNESSYSFKDGSLPSTVTYYRIKMVEISGAISYSKLISISGSDIRTKIYPSFVTDQAIYVYNDQPLKAAALLITDMSGRLLSRKSLGMIPAKQTTSLLLNELKLRHGMFIVQLADGNEVIKTERILVN